MRLLPGEKKSLGFGDGFALVTLTVTDDVYPKLLEPNEPPLRWSLFVDNAQQQKGLVPYDEWCQF
jgi:hypothetical protein